jgi:uncharacterized membrane protein
VLAIIITIMVLEMKVPHGSDLADIKPLLPVAMSYLLSFVYIGIYWNNHHHMLHAAQRINGKIMWANMHLLFWLSLVPFASGWMGENNFDAWPTILYGIILLMNGVAYYILSRFLIQLHGRNSTLATAIGKDTKGILSILIYVLAIALAFIDTRFSLGLYTVVAIMWLIPDKRIEKKVSENNKNTIH